MAFFRDLFSMDESKQAHAQIFGGENGEEPHHQSTWTHEAVAGAAAFAAMQAYESHLRTTGQQVSNPVMKEMLAAFAAAEVDKLFESKGLDELDREKTKMRAIEQAHHIANRQGQGEHHHHHHREE